MNFFSRLLGHSWPGKVPVIASFLLSPGKMRARSVANRIFSKLLKLIPILAKLNNKHSDAINKLQTKESRGASSSNETDQ